MLTRSGLGAIVAALVMFFLGLRLNYEELVVASLGIALVLMLAVLITRRSVRSKVERRLMTVRVPRGDPVRVVYRVSNATRHRSSRATVIDQCDDATITIPVSSVSPGELLDVPASIPTRRRGVFEVGPLDIEKVDPFFLAVGRWRRQGDQQNFVTVHPKIYDLSGTEGASRIVENESVIRRAASDPMSGFVSMREYVAGDDPRLIHWPTTARTGTLMVRENVEVRRPEFTVVVDTGSAIGTDDDFEEAVDVAATLAVHALRSGLDVVVRSTDREHPGRPEPLRSEAEVLDLLTPLQRSSDSPLDLATLFANGFDHTSILFVTGPDGPSSRVTSNDRMVTVRVGEGAEAGGHIALAAHDAPDFVKGWRSLS